MKPWQYEAGTIHYNEETFNNIYKNKVIEDYLNVTDHDHNFILIGAKGIGKTLLINLKSLLFREKYSGQEGYIYPHRAQLCENLVLDNGLLSKKDILKFANESLWNKIWRFAFSYLICKISKIDQFINGEVAFCPTQSRSAEVGCEFSEVAEINDTIKRCVAIGGVQNIMNKMI